MTVQLEKNEYLSKDEMITLKTELLKCEDPTICPAGNRTFLNLKNADLEIKFFFTESELI